MQKKTLVLGLFGLTGMLVALAYAAGKQSNRLSVEQTNFDGYQSENYAQRLTAEVWDKVMKGLTFWAKNHESRLQAYASNPKYPNLTDEETSFLDLLAVKHDDQLTSGMRDGLVSKLTLVSTNHEMRLRALEDKPVAQNGSCDGEYQDSSTIYEGKPVDIHCYEFKESFWEKNHNKSSELDLEGERKSSCVYGRYQKYSNKEGSKFYPATLDSSNGEPGPNQRYVCDEDFKNNSKYCEKKPFTIKKSCTSLDETACKTKPGCTWKQ